jgi:biotin transport system substrate-specific component
MARASTDVLIDRIPVGRNFATDAIWIVSLSLVTAALAQISFHLPFTPVPITGQTFGVLLSGALMGWRRAFVSQILYLAVGAAGLPVFADGTSSAAHLLGASGGYLLSFPLAAAFVGFFVEKGLARSTWKLAGVLISADVLILVAGSTWLRFLFRVPFAQAWMLGFYPFLIVDFAKISLVGLSLPRILRGIETLEKESSES